MNFNLAGKNLDLTPALKAYSEEKIGGLSKFDDQIIELRVTIESLREQHAESFRVTAQLHVSHDVLYTEEVAATAYAAIDIVKDELERQLRDRKERYQAKQRKAASTQRALKSTLATEE
ncbi:MAG: ribosome-associated translation inhibitor RaiA [Candidatus Kerfeldbacteria bacterium]|nr:ribosome-associated translation inhibitor RaiA [Candidatus Kerfeldbacteria bacterium]